MIRKLIVSGLVFMSIPMATVLAQHWPYYPPGAPYPRSIPPYPGRYYGPPPGYGRYNGEFTRPYPGPMEDWRWRTQRRGVMPRGPYRFWYDE